MMGYITYLYADENNKVGCENFMVQKRQKSDWIDDLGKKEHTAQLEEDLT
jgi:hypothetical protein